MEDRDWSYYPVTPPQPRQKPMRVLCFGLSRTATISLYLALSKLGYTPYHGIEATLDHRNDSLKHWHEAIDAKFYNKGKKYKGSDFEKMLWRYDAVVELPSYFFVDELIEAYPDAKVVLNTRDADKWAMSIQNTFGKVLKWKRWAILEFLDPQYVAHYIPILRHCLATWTRDDPDTDHLIFALKRGFLTHNEHVRRAVPASRLLEWDIKDGWAPLCAFLDKPVPKPKPKPGQWEGRDEEGEEEEPFPRVNEGGFIVDVHAFMFWKRLAEVLWIWARWMLPVLVPLVGAGWWLGRVRP